MKPGSYLAVLIWLSAGSLAAAQEPPPDVEALATREGIQAGFVTCHGSFALRGHTGTAIYVRPLEDHVYEKKLVFNDFNGHIWWYKDEDPDHAVFYLGFGYHHDDHWKYPVYFGYYHGPYWHVWHLGRNRWHHLSAVAGAHEELPQPKLHEELPQPKPREESPQPKQMPPATTPENQTRIPRLGKATITVFLPPDAQLRVNGESLRAGAATRVFTAPGLKVGQAYSYTFQATAIRGGKVQSAQRQVLVKAGDRVEVYLTDAAVSPPMSMAAAN